MRQTRGQFVYPAALPGGWQVEEKWRQVVQSRKVWAGLIGLGCVTPVRADEFRIRLPEGGEETVVARLVGSGQGAMALELDAPLALVQALDSVQAPGGGVQLRMLERDRAARSLSCVTLTVSKAGRVSERRQ